MVVDLACPHLASTEKGQRGRDRITCPELFSLGACPCDIFLPGAKAICCEYKGGFRPPVTHWEIHEICCLLP